MENIIEVKLSNLQSSNKFSTLLPALSGEEFQLLKESIDANGVQTPLIVKESGEIISGNARYRACVQLLGEARGSDSVPVIYKSFETEAEEQVFIIGEQLSRRNLSDAAKVRLLYDNADLLEVLKKQASEKHPTGSIHRKTAQIIADYTGIGRTKVNQIKKILDSGTEDQKEALLTDQQTANKIAGTPKEKPEAVWFKHPITGEFMPFYPAPESVYKKGILEQLYGFDYCQEAIVSANQIQHLRNRTNEEVFGYIEDLVVGKKIHPESFRMFGDMNRADPAIKKCWFSKDGDQIDLICQELSMDLGLEVEPQQIIDVIEEFPFNRFPKPDDLRKEEERFFELTGIKPTIKKLWVVLDAIDRQIKAEDQEAEVVEQIEVEEYDLPF